MYKCNYIFYLTHLYNDLNFAGREYASDKKACGVSQLASWNTGDSSEMLLDQ